MTPPCPLCGSATERTTAPGPLPFRIGCVDDACPVELLSDDEELLEQLWRSQAAIPRYQVAGGFVLLNAAEGEEFAWKAPETPPPARPRPVPPPTPATDPRVHVLAQALREIECGGPGGLVTWGTTGMRDRARAALEEAGLLSPGARRRAERELLVVRREAG